jgi:hypothetical protein
MRIGIKIDYFYISRSAIVDYKGSTQQQQPHGENNMKSFIATLAFLIATPFAHAMGPFVSGGMPDQVNCQNSHFALKVTVLGGSGGGALVDSRTPEIQAALNCKTVNQAEPTLISTTLLYVCSSSSSEGVVKIFKNTESNTRWAMIFEQLSNGRKFPTTAACR